MNEQNPLEGAFEMVTLKAPAASLSVHSLQQRAEFHQVEPVFKAFMRTYPLPLEVPCPPQLSPATVANRLRNGAKALLHHRWPQNFSLDEFEAAWKACCVRQTASGTLVITLRTAKLADETPVSLMEASGSQPGQVTTKKINEPGALECLAWVHHFGIFEKETHMPALTKELADAFEELLKRNPMNVSFIKHPKESGYLLF